VEGLVGYARRNFMVPRPRFATWEAFNAHLQVQSQKRRERKLRGHQQTIGERFEKDRERLLSLPAAPYEACDKRSTRVTSMSLVRYRTNDYSVPVEWGHREVLVKGFVHEVVICAASEVIARHPRSYEREDMIFNPLHYLALLEQKTNALDQAAPLVGLAIPSLNKSLVLDLARGEFIERKENILALGNSGTPEKRTSRWPWAWPLARKVSASGSRPRRRWHTS
jgi:hypothetical protein